MSQLLLYGAAGVVLLGLTLGLLFRSTWRMVLALIAIATVMVFVGGVGWVTCRIQEWDAARMVFQAMLVIAIAITFLSLTVALVVGCYHLYLHWFTDRKPLGLFATTTKDDE